MPSTAPVLLRRPRLHDHLDRPGFQLSVIAGPSGFGKTSLARSWVSTLATNDVIWVTLENDLESRSAFWQTVLAGAARRGLMGGPEAATGLMTEIEEHPDPAAVIARGLAESTDPLLVVDAYEKIREMTGQVDDDVMRLVRLVPQLRVVVTTRTSSGLASPARGLRGEVQLLTEEDLAFTVEETRDLLAAFADSSTDAAADSATVKRADRLHQATHGYPLALRAAMLAQGRGRPAPHQTEDGWRALVAEDLRLQLEHGSTYEFVLSTSVPPYFDEELAAELAGSISSPAEVKEVLDDLEWNGFGRWIPFAPGRQVFQYVESLRDALRVEAEQRPQAQQLRAAELSAMWLHRHGSHEAALEMAVSAGLFGIAARVYAAVVVTNQSVISSNLVDRHLARVPSRALTQYPGLAFGRGLACYRDPSLRAAAAEYFKISAAWDKPRFPNPTVGEFLLGTVAKTVSLRLLGRIDESARVARQALELHDGIPAIEQEQLGALRPMTLRQLAYSQFLAAELDPAWDVTMRAVSLATDPIVRNHSVVYAVGLGAVDGRVAQARSAQALLDHDAWRPGEDRTYVNALGLIGDAALRLDAFDFEGVLAAYDGAQFRDTAEFWPLVTWTLLHAHIGLGQAATEAQRVAEELQRKPEPPGMADSLAAAMARSALALAWLAAGNRSKATPLLRARSRYAGQLAPAVLLGRLLSGDGEGALAALPRLQAQSGHTIRSSAALLALGAAAAVRTGGEEAAASLLERLVAHVGPDGVRAHLMYLPEDDLVALRRIAEAQGTDAVRAHLADPVPAVFTGETTVAALTGQERAVVTAMVHHPTRASVASALHVSENTVKTHLQRTYRKLGVNSRAGVIERAIELGLLDPA